MKLRPKIISTQVLFCFEPLHGDFQKYFLGLRGIIFLNFSEHLDKSVSFVCKYCCHNEQKKDNKGKKTSNKPKGKLNG